MSETAGEATPVIPASNSTKGIEVSDWDSLVAAQLATANYVRAGLALFVAAMVSTSFVALGNQAEFQKLLQCSGELFCAASGGAPFYWIGAIASGIAIIAAIIFSAKGTRHRRNAGD